ncbi:MAG: hypothetical protein E6G94_15655 [Alphaproteobacteria bacterium]|nr:MAG: hypothetical protein E6G94_15655 [Alphaproteobacteria bacterium]
MMRPACLAIALLMSASAGSAGAQAAKTGDVPVSANVDGVCRLGPPSRPSVNFGDIAAHSGARVGRLAALLEVTVDLPHSYCNFGGTKVTIRAEALVSPDVSELPPGFARAVNYTSTVTTWATTAPLITTSASADGASPVAEGSGGTEPAAKLTDLTLALSGFNVPSDARLMAGNYHGQITITLGPAVTDAPEGE